MIVAALDVFVDSLQFIVDERELLLEKTWEHIVLSGAALLVSIAIAVPLGVALGHLHRGSFVAVNVANVGRALPTLVVIAVGFIFLGIGFTTVMLALVVLAVPPILTNAYVAVDEVDRDAVEAARGMGMTPPRCCDGSSCRSRCRCSSPASARRPSSSSRPRRSPRSRAERPRRDPREPGGYKVEGLVGAAICVSLLALAADAALGVVQRWLTPAGLKEDVPAFEPDVRPVV